MLFLFVIFPNQFLSCELAVQLPDAGADSSLVESQTRHRLACPQCKYFLLLFERVLGRLIPAVVVFVVFFIEFFLSFCCY
jgi:hypothetical protein